MYDNTRLDVQPVENHDVIVQSEIVVVELVYIRVCEVDAVVMSLVDGIHHCAVADAVTITIDDFSITIAFRVVDHLDGNGEIELILLEIVTDGRFDVQVSVLGETEQ